VRRAYAVLAWLLAPVFVGHLLWRSLRQPAYRRRIPERFGFGFAPLPTPGILVHAVSVGEVTAAAPLVRELQARYPAVPVVLTTMTPTGSQRARALLGDSVIHSYVPYDSPGAVRRFFRWARPALAIILETEIWPSLYEACGRRGVPLVLASARVSARSAGGYRILFGLIRDTLANGIVIGAQSAADAARFHALGASPARTHVTGNIKFDFRLPADLRERSREFRARHAGTRPVWVAGSTHEGEEEIALQAHRQLLARHPDALLLLVPRHPERFGAVTSLLARSGLTFVTRGSGADCHAGVQVFLGDSMGELGMFYGAGDVAFVGGSLVPVGGHNLLEPAALGMPVLTGPLSFNAPDIAALLSEEGAAAVVRDAAELAAELSRLVESPEERERRGQLGRAALERNRGAVERLLALVAPLMGSLTSGGATSAPAPASSAGSTSR
jgi:3-deoxy-D-manno-octulosonic-acid transferase